MNKYEKLQEVLNSLIEKGWKPKNVLPARHQQKLLEDHYKIVKVTCNIYGIMTCWKGPLKKILNISYNDLFSKDSGLMEFVEWKGKGKIGVRIGPIDGYTDVEYEYVEILNNTRGYHAMMMSNKTADEKIDYFLDNIVY